MDEKIASQPLFAGRYRFETISADWDRGRSGYTHQVIDVQTNRKGVIKRAKITSPEAIQSLQNELGALRALKGLGVPDLYETGQANYGTKEFQYIVIEYIDGVRLEKELYSLSGLERAEILTQFFSLLAQAHKMGISNGDVDLKHLFWRSENKQLIVIDWGNAHVGSDPTDETQFSFDLARSAEILFALVTKLGHPSMTGSLALPIEQDIWPGLVPLPVEYYSLCKWAPRTPSDGLRAPYTALELFESSKKWQASLGQIKSKTKSIHQRSRSFWISIFAIILFVWLTYYLVIPSVLYSPPPLTPSQTPITPTTQITIKTLPSIGTDTPPYHPETLTPTVFPRETATLIPTAALVPSVYYPLLNFDEKLILDNCWQNETNSSTGLTPTEGLSRRDDKNWRFLAGKNRLIDDFVQVDFSQCFHGQQIMAISLNAWMARLEPEREFGFFLENNDGSRREYTILVDEKETMHLRMRENSLLLFDETILIINPNNLNMFGEYPRYYYQFPIQFFFEINNQRLDILYLREGSKLSPVKIDELNPNYMIRIDPVIIPTLGEIQKIGIIGRGGETQIFLWPLVFFGK